MRYRSDTPFRPYCEGSEYVNRLLEAQSQIRTKSFVRADPQLAPAERGFATRELQIGKLSSHVAASRANPE